MKSFLKFSEKNSKKSGKLVIVLFLILMSFSFLVIKPKPVEAQFMVLDTLSATLAQSKNVWDKLQLTFKYLWQKSGSMAFQQTLRTVLNKVAIDTANYVGSGGEGQKPLFVTKDWGTYLADVGDEAAGAYLENFASNMSATGDVAKKNKQTSDCKKNCDSSYENSKNSIIDSANYEIVDGVAQKNPDLTALAAVSAGKTTCYTSCNSNNSNGLSNSLATPSFNVCQPSSIDAKLKITLGLAEQNRSQGPDCSASDIIKNWSNLDNYGNSVQALKDLYESTQGGYNDQLFLNDIKGIFDPSGNDIGIYLTAKSDSAAIVDNKKVVTTNTLVGKGGWLDATLINGSSKSLPNQAEISSAESYKQYSENFGKYTGDAFVDALNTFLSQTAYTAFNTLMKNLGKTSTQGSSNPDLTNPNGGSITTGEGAIKEASNKLNQPDFSSRANYDILSQLSICQNKDNPGPTDCVIDNKLMQAIAEQKTVMEAVKDGSLNGAWQMTKDNISDAYTLRNVSILRKYRILPVGWEVAISRTSSDQAHIRQATLNDLISCFDPNSDYKKFSSNFNQRDQDWCRNLVDPNWVLKAPLNSCNKLGIGGQVLNFSVNDGVSGLAGQPDTLSSYIVTRAEDYCADPQTCIKEKNDGSCDAYGYCSEEKRTWNFGSDSCQPINNTCQTFTGGATSKTVSYLENTLDYSNCNAASAGCRQYSLTGNYASGTVLWDAAKSLFFNGSQTFTTCDQSSEGCTGLIRVKSTNGTNLVINSDFSADTVGDSNIKGNLNAWPINGAGDSWKATIVDAQSDSLVSSRTLKLEATGAAGANIFAAVYSDKTNSLVPKNLQIISGQAYTLSADVYLVDGDKAQVTIGSETANIVYNEISTKNSWQHISITRSPISSFNEPVFFIRGYGNTGKVTIYIKNIKFEASNVANNYSVYGAAKVYEKLLPNYLEKTCYVDSLSATKDYSLKTDAPAVCKNFARKCNKDEVGCELYKSDSNSFSIAAKVSSVDLCPQECLNYDVYIARANSFNLAQKENLIPANTKKCNAQEVGCNEFTNLDSLNQGGEKKEYYTELKQCIKPSTSECGAYYAWEGTESGYQLKSYNLKKGTDGGPAVSTVDSALCNSAIYHSAITSPNYNSDCLEFYNAAGQISYHLLTKTVTCSDDCHSYRLTEKNIDPSIAQATACTGSDKYWNAQNSTCQVCLNGGIYDTNHGACLYQAIPSEGKTCQAAANNCREYNGSNGENVRLISASDFESTNKWSSNCVNGLSLSPIANTNNGHSLKYNNSANSCQAIGETAQTNISRTPLIKQILASDGIAAQLNVSGSVEQGLSYNISFLARANSQTNLKIYFYNKETKEKSYFNAAAGVSINGGNEWQIYKASLENLDHTVSDNEILAISADNDFYLDNFVLNEVSQRYYLIKDSSQIPTSCYYDNFGIYQGLDYNLGCRQYSDRANVKHNFRQFSKLCADSGVGCEQMIDTKNYTPGGAGFWNDTNKNNKCDGDEPDCVSVEADTAIYAVYDAKKLCNVADLGCSRLGQGAKVGTSNVWTDVFKRNNPDNYNSILCRQVSVGCEKWSDNDNGLTYFKDPGFNTCLYKMPAGSAVKNWYKSPVKRCDKDKSGKIEGAEMTSVTCSSNSDCGTGNSCLTDNNDYPCPTSYLKTFGLGGAGNQVPVPYQAAGLCEAKESTCTEYIDPISSFVPNLVYNSDFKIGSSSAEGWINGNQTIKLEAYKLYIFSVEPAASPAGDTKLTFTADIKPLLNNNSLGTSTKELIIKDGASQLQQLFYSLSNTTATVSGPNINKNIIVKPAVVDYQLQSNITEEGCNGNVNFDQGCILFNERSVNGGNGSAVLISDAYKTVGTTRTNCNSSLEGSCNANKLIKVKPNRICAKWLSCVTYAKDVNSDVSTCYALGECNRLSDDNKECANFIDIPSNSIRVFDTKRDKDASGYSLMNRYYFGQMKEVGLNSDFHYGFEDLVPSLSCLRDRGDGVTSDNCSFDKNNIAKDLLVREKVGSPADYPANGKSYLKVPSGYLISPQVAGYGIPLLKDKDYYLNFLVNTKTSGVGAKVYIKTKNSETEPFRVFAAETYSANNGWERKVLKFHTDNTGLYYRIELGSDTPTQEANVYFDDLNIEPVLEVAPNQYVSRECRLYPETSSLTCNDSVAKDGFEGYCLEHDLKNPSVCSLWYPVDHINSAETGKALAGYNGVAPLSYCTQVSGNFDLVKKVVGSKIFDGRGGDQTTRCEKTTQRCRLGIGSGAIFADDNYVAWISHHYNSANLGDFGGGENYTKVFCVPDQTKLKLQTKLNTIPPDANNDGLNECAGETYYDGWVLYNGFAPVFNYSCGDNSINGCSNIDEPQNDPENPVRVYDYNNEPNSEAGLKLVSGSDSEQNFRLTCENFSQVVSNSGENMAWSDRVSSKSYYATATPPFFLDGDIWYGDVTSHNLSRYGRNRENIPFGAAVLPANVDLLNSEAIKLRGQYSSSNKETVFAGRPYGCYNNSGSGCANIGSCSLNPDVYCLTDSISTTSVFNINKKTCGDGGYGTCQPLWNTALSPVATIVGGTPDFKKILSSLFLRTYYSYSYNNSFYSASAGATYGRYDFSNIITCSPTRPADNLASSFCAIYPELTNVKLKLNGQLVAGSYETVFNILTRGIYTLEFNSIIDKEQQPLKEIYINWGDGTDQVISGQDAHPSVITPHIFYHYYSQTASRQIKIKITDNWGKYNTNN